MNDESPAIPIIASYWIIPGRFRAGEYPSADDEDETRGKLRWLLWQGINMMIDLSEEGEANLQPYILLLHQESGKILRVVHHRRMPIQDWSTPDRDRVVEILDAIDLALSLGRNVYLHCHGGKGRTGIVVGCFLVRHGMSGAEALEKIKELRKDIPINNTISEKSPETERQIRMVLEWKRGQ